MTDTAFLERTQAALRLIHHDASVDRELVFSYVLWPTEAVEEAAPAWGRNVTATEIRRMAELAAEGLSHRQISERLGRPKATVGAALRAHSRV